MSELHFIPDKEKKFRQILTDREYASIAYPLLKNFHSIEQYNGSNASINVGNVPDDLIYGMIDLLEKRRYIKNIDGMHYKITKEGINHLGELERKVR